MKFPRYGCLSCRTHTASFDACVNHMERRNHFVYNSDGTIRMSYPVLIQTIEELEEILGVDEK